MNAPIRFSHRSLALLLCLALPLIGHTANIITTNPDFEGTFDSSGMASNWADNSINGGANVAYSAETAWPHKGANSQGIQIVSYTAGDYTQFKHDVTIEDGKSYRLSVSLKSDQDNLPVVVQLRRASIPYTAYIERTVQLNRGWQNFRFEGSVDGAASSETAFFMIRCVASTTAKIWVDDAAVEDLGAAIAPHGGFETGSSGLGTGWTDASTGTITFSLDAITKHLGLSAQKAVIGTGATVRLQQTAALTANRVYRVRAAVRIGNTAVKPEVQFTDSSGSVYVRRAIAPTATAQWQEFEVDLLAPVTNSTAQVRLVAANPTGGSVNLWFDDVSVVDQGASLLANGTFEGSFTSTILGSQAIGDVASSWVDDSVDQYRPTYSQDGGEDSVAAQMIEVASTLNGPSQFRQGAIVLTKGHAYRYQFSIKHSSASAAMIEAQLRTTAKIQNADYTGRPLTSELTTVVRPGTEWQTFTCEGVVMEDVSNASIIFRMVEPGTFWFDNASLIDLGPCDSDLILSPPADTAMSAKMFGLHILNLTPGTDVANYANDARWPGIEVSSLRLWDAQLHWPYLKWTTDLDWKWTRLDWYRGAMNLEGGDVILPLALSPHWASARPSEASAYQAGTPFALGWAAEPASTTDWQTYVSTVANHASAWDNARYYEVWNEVNQKSFYSGELSKLAELVSTARTALLAVNSNNKVIGPSVVGSPAFLDRVYRANYSGTSMSDLVDVVSYHFYSYREPEFFLPTIDAIKAVLKSNGLQNKPFWNTEFGMYIDDVSPATSTVSPQWTAAQAGDFLARAYLLYWAMGVERSYYYAWDHGTLGLFQTNYGVPKTEAVLGFDCMRSWLVGKKMKTCWRSADGFWVAQLETTTSATEYIVWHPDATSSGLSWPTPAGITQYWTRSTETPITISGDTVTVYSAPILLQ